MREKRTIQASIFEYYPEHEIGRELKAMSAWLDENLDLLDWVAADVMHRHVEETGRKGLTIDSVLRCALLEVDSVWRSIIETYAPRVPRPLSCRTKSSRKRQCTVISNCDTTNESC